MSLVNYQYPTTKELREINPEKIQNLTRERPTFQIFPTVDSNYWTLEWTQRDNWKGFQQLRGLNGEPSYVTMVGERAFSAKPGVYGEYMTVDETMMTLRAQQVPSGEPVEIGDLIAERQDYLNNREVDLLEFIHWKALLDGQFTFIGPTGAVYGDVFPIQTASFSDWSVLATATPILDLMGLKVLSAGKSVAFDSGATIYANSITVGYLLRNQNPLDLAGQMAIAQGGIKPNKTLLEINTLLQGFNLPKIVEYDEGYNRESDGAFVKWIPNDVMSIVGRRTNGDRLGEYRMLRNAQNANMAPGRYEEVIDHLGRRIPRLIEVHRGHNGGLVIFYGSAIVKATC
jgi:hypothetical protein